MINHNKTYKVRIISLSIIIIIIIDIFIINNEVKEKFVVIIDLIITFLY